MSDLFIKATRVKLRFNCSGGAYTVEDLWDLPISTKTGAGVTLDSLYRQFNKELSAAQEEGLVPSKTAPKTDLAQLRVDIIRYVFEVKSAEADKKQKAAELKAQKDKIRELIAQKQDDSLASQRIEDLQKLLKSLEEASDA